MTRPAALAERRFKEKLNPEKGKKGQRNMKKQSNRKLIEGIGVGDKPMEFPIASVEYVRNVVSYLNTKYYVHGKRWRSASERERGVVQVFREK